MKDKILILGNGFDLNLGLKTSYTDFMNSRYFKKDAIDFMDSLYYYLNHKRNISQWFDLENELKNYAKHERSEYAKEEFNSLIKSLREYLYNIEYNLKKDSVAYKVLNAATKSDTFNKIYTFNYTNLKGIGEAMQINMDSVSIEHIHGNVEEHSIILGFEDEADVDESNLYMIKSFSPHYQSHNIQYDLEEAKDVIFFGHSLGSTDYHYFENFFQKQSRANMRKEEAKKITIFTYNNQSKINILTQLRRMNNNRTDLLFCLNHLQILCTGEEKDRVKIENYCQELINEKRKMQEQLDYVASRIL